MKLKRNQRTSDQDRGALDTDKITFGEGGASTH